MYLDYSLAISPAVHGDMSRTNIDGLLSYLRLSNTQRLR
jgi:hypothetical protein